MTRTITTYILTTIMIITMVVPVSLVQAQTPARTLTPTQATELTSSLTELLTAVKGLQAALAAAPTGQVLGVSIANNAPVIDGETYSVTGPGEVIRGTERTDRVVADFPSGVRVGAINLWAPLGKELSLVRTQPAYTVIANNSTAVIDGVTYEANYWTTNVNVADGAGTTTLTDSAVETAGYFGAIVFDVEVIEGGDGNDHFSGRESDDYFVPKSGADWISGGGGFDTVEFSGASTDYELIEEENWFRLRSGTYGLKTLPYTSEAFVFADGTYTYEGLMVLRSVENAAVVTETTEPKPGQSTSTPTEQVTTEPATEPTEEEPLEAITNADVPTEIEAAITEDVTQDSLTDTPQVAITTAITTTLTPTPDFQPNSTITLSDNVNVRDPFGLQGRITGIQPAGSQGTIIDITPQDADGYTWIPVDFQSGPDGWVASDFTDYDPTIEVDQDGFTILQLENPDSTIITFENIEESDLPTEDTEYDYPHGLHDFTLEVEPNSTETVTIYLEAEINTNDKEIRKYNPDTEEYETITDQVTFGTADLADTTVTTLTYDVIDNGPLDNDPRVGFIVDPVGVGEEVMMGMHTPDLSGLTDNDHNTHDAGTTLHEEHDVLFDLMPYSEATHIAAQSGAWSDPATWQHNAIPGDNARVIIPEDITVTYATTSDARLFTVRVDGNLHFSTTEDSQMIVDTLASGVKSEFYIGTESNPVPENVTVDIIIANNGDIDTTWDTELISRGVILHGETKMHGHKKTTHGKVSVDPMAGDTSITMAETPSGWQVGDTIVVAGSRYEGWHWHETEGGVQYFGSDDEVRTITAINGRTVTFIDPLIHNHDTPRSDLKVSVGNYTRNITITTEDPDSALIHERGHFMQMHSDEVDVRYVAFEELGRTIKVAQRADPIALNPFEFSPLLPSSNVKGRYSMHFHRTGVTDLENPAIAIGNSIYGSPGWGYVHHDSNATFHNNVSYDTQGAGFVAETGNETGEWTHNLAIYAPGTSRSGVKNSDNPGDFNNGTAGVGFFFQGRAVDSIGNIAASANVCFGFFHRSRIPQNLPDSRLDHALYSDADQFTYPAAFHDTDNITADDVPILDFRDNEANGCNFGFNLEKASFTQGHDLYTHLDDFLAWNVNQGAIIAYTAHYILEDFELIAVDPPAGSDRFWRSYDGILLGQNMADVVLLRPKVSGFTTGINLKKDHNTTALRGAGDAEHDMHYVVVDPVLSGNVTDYASYDPTVDHIIASDNLQTDQFAINFPSLLRYEDDNTSSVDFQRVQIEGSKLDSVGSIMLPTYDDYDVTFTQVIGLLEENGFYTNSATEKYFVYEDYFTDRGTGEVHKIGIPVRVEGGAVGRLGSPFHAYKNAIDLGIPYNFDSNPPQNSNITARTDQNEDVIIDLLQNASDPDGDEVFVDGILQPEYGRVFIRSNGRVMYRPDIDYTGQDSFKYWVRDIYGNFTPAYVSIGVDERAEELPKPEAPEIDITPDPVDPDPEDPETPPEDSVESIPPTPGTGRTTIPRGTITDLDKNGQLDELEDRLSTLINKLHSDNRYNTLALKEALSRIRNFYNRTEAELKEDVGYQYPVGLFEFEAEVDPGSTETITIYLDQVYDTTDWVYRKYNENTDTYLDISDQVTYSTEDVDGTSVTTITYDVLDNGPLDTDDRLGFIKDPAGPGVPEEEDSGSSSGSSGGSSSGGSSGGSSSSGSSGSSGSSSGSGPSSGSSASSDSTASTNNPVTTTTPVTTPTQSSIPTFFSFNNNISFIQTGINQPADVRYLETFLNEFENENLTIDGIYGVADNEAMKRFQRKYRQEILDIWNLSDATGYVGITTRLKMNFLLKGQSAQCPVFTEYHGGKSDTITFSPEIGEVQKILQSLDMYTGPINNTWGPQVHESMITFQETFREVMLDPWNISQGTGRQYKTTNKFLNYFAGCDTGAVELDGEGTFDF